MQLDPIAGELRTCVQVAMVPGVRHAVAMARLPRRDPAIPPAAAVAALVFVALLVFFGRDLGRLGERFTAASDGQVVGVIDGETIEVTEAGKSILVRLHGVDAPDLDQPFGPEARQFLAALLYGRVVGVEHSGVDKDGTTLARVFLDGRDIGREVISAGLARRRAVDGREDPELAAAELEARDANRGLWQDSSSAADLPPE